MKKRKMMCLFTLFGCLGATTLSAQHGIVVSGGDASGSNGKVSYSVGQIDYKYVKDSGGTISPGIQQPFEIFIISGVEEKRIHLDLSSSVYPNPTSGSVTLKVEGYSLVDLSYEIHDMQGRLLIHKKVDGNESLILMNEFANASYFIQILDHNSPVKIFKVIKN